MIQLHMYLWFILSQIWDKKGVPLQEFTLIVYMKDFPFSWSDAVHTELIQGEIINNIMQQLCHKNITNQIRESL